MSQVTMQLAEKQFYKPNLPGIRPGDTVQVMHKIVEGENERIQVYEGAVIAIKGQGLSRNIIVRKISFGVGVEKTFPLNSPRVEEIKVVKRGKVRRAKLYYIRDRVGKESRIDENKEFVEKKLPETPAAEPAGQEKPA